LDKEALAELIQRLQQTGETVPALGLHQPAAEEAAVIMGPPIQTEPPAGPEAGLQPELWALLELLAKETVLLTLSLGTGLRVLAEEAQAVLVVLTMEESAEMEGLVYLPA
jgi:hypothetical protein